MSTTESTYWSLEMTDEKIDREADAGDFILDCESLLRWSNLFDFEDEI